MVAPVVNQDFGALRDGASDPQDEAIRIRCGEAELPEREAEAARQLFCGVNRRLRWEHRRCAVLKLRRHRTDECGWGVAGQTDRAHAIVFALKDQGLTSFKLPIGPTIVIMVMSFIVGLFAAIYPAWRATRVNILDALNTN